MCWFPFSNLNGRLKRYLVKCFSQSHEQKKMSETVAKNKKGAHVKEGELENIMSVYVGFMDLSSIEMLMIWMLIFVHFNEVWRGCYLSKVVVHMPLLETFDIGVEGYVLVVPSG